MDFVFEYDKILEQEFLHLHSIFRVFISQSLLLYNQLNEKNITTKGQVLKSGPYSEKSACSANNFLYFSRLSSFSSGFFAFFTKKSSGIPSCIVSWTSIFFSSLFSLANFCIFSSERISME